MFSLRIPIRLSLTLAFCAATLSQAIAAQATVINGRASIIDGDTLEIHGQSIRLHGIDAPEAGQTCEKNSQIYRCGQKAAQALDRLVTDRPITCTKMDTDRYNRVIAVCSVKGIELNRAMVQQGWALAYTQYSKDYVVSQKEAETAKVGLWSGTFQLPWEYRRAPAPEESKTADGCLIKGNINSKGRKLYHLPGSNWYGKTRINLANGERWFCTEQQAISAGWLKAAP